MEQDMAKWPPSDAEQDRWRMDVERERLGTIGLQRDEIEAVIAKRRARAHTTVEPLTPVEQDVVRVSRPSDVEEVAQAIPCICCREDGVAFYNGQYVCLRCTFAYCYVCKRCLGCCMSETHQQDVRLPR